MFDNSCIDALKYLVMLSPIVYYILYRKLTHPICIFIGILSLQYIVYQFFQPGHYSLLTQSTEYSIFGGMWAFVLGFSFISVLGFIVRKRLQIKLVYRPRGIDFSRIEQLYSLSVYMSIVVIIGHFWVGYKNGVSGTYSSFLVNVRMQYLIEPSSFSLLPHVAIFLQSWFSCLIIHGYKVNKSAFVFLLLSILCALSKLERSAIITCLLALVVLKDHGSVRGVPLRNISLGVGFVVGIFFFVAWQFDPNRTISDVLFVFLDYFSKNLDTFNKYISPLAPTYDWGLVLGKYAGLLGLDINEDLIDIDVDGSFNTYSYLKNLYLFGGTSFVFVFNVIIGVIFSVFYEFRYKMNGVVLGFLSFFSFSLFVSFFAYSFAWTNWAYYFISFAILYSFSKGSTTSSVIARV